MGGGEYVFGKIFACAPVADVAATHTMAIFGGRVISLGNWGD